MDPATIGLLKDLGYPAALSVVLLFAVKFMFSIYSAAQTARIDALERAFLAAKKTNDEQAGQLLARSDKHAAELRAIIAANQAAINEGSKTTRGMQEILRKLVDAIGESWSSSTIELPAVKLTKTEEHSKS
jgi:hypothetical protein